MKKKARVYMAEAKTKNGGGKKVSVTGCIEGKDHSGGDGEAETGPGELDQSLVRIECFTKAQVVGFFVKRLKWGNLQGEQPRAHCGPGKKTLMYRHDKSE